MLCRACHADRHRQRDPLVVLVGLSGTGKTAIREQLAARLGVQSLGPDETSWQDIHDRLPQGGVVETARIPGRLARRVGGLGGLIVKVTAPTEVRAERLRQRGETDSTIRARLAETDAITYEEQLEPDRTVSTATATPAQIAADLAAWVDTTRTRQQTSL